MPMAKETTLEEVGETLSYIVANMATKEDIAELRKELKTDIASVHSDVQGIYEELRSIKRSIVDLYEKVENISGFRQEIDHALGRIAVIERHLGIST
jgi:uncharacterized coiled-coil DUF342 family protein